MNRTDEPLRELKDDQAQLKELYLASHGVGRTWRVTGAVCGLAGGCLTALLGTLLSAGAWTLGDETGVSSLHILGSILLLATIPLLVFGAHCLDLLERYMEQGRRENAHDAVKTARLNGSAPSHVVQPPALFF
ncbi:MAG TPA: hypothetical protein VGC64_10405 [Pyrinomonadaceae bacterium]